MRLKCNSLSILMIPVLVLLAGLNVFAQVSSLSAPTSGTGTSNLKLGKNKKNTDDFRFKLEADAQAISYTEASNVDSNFQQRFQVGLNLRKEGLFFSDTNLILGTFSEPQSFYYALPEAYVGYGTKDSNVTVGRKKENLSFSDSFFNFGLLQSHFTNDNVYFIEGGLTGITGHFSSEDMGVVLSYDPIFLPNQAPQATAKDGKIVSSNRWTSQPPSKFKFGDQYKDINYAVRDYQITDLIANSGYTASIYFGKNRKRPAVLLTYANKPVNDIAFSRETYSDISTFQGFVYLTPLVLTHQVAAADINLDSGLFKSTLSFLGDQPVNQKAADQEYIQTLNALAIYSAYASLDFSSYFDKKFEIYAGTAIIEGGEIKDVNSEGKESTFAISNSRTLFKRPVVMGLKAELFYIFNQALETDTSLTYDQQLKGSLMSINFRYAPMAQLKINLGADLIGIENELPTDAQGNFLDQNKANDRVFAGLNYAF